MENSKIKVFVSISCRILKTEIKAKFKNLSDRYALHFVGNSIDHFSLRDFGADFVIKRKDDQWDTIVMNHKIKHKLDFIS